jgi:hypothetical protein
MRARLNTVPFSLKKEKAAANLRLWQPVAQTTLLVMFVLVNAPADAVFTVIQLALFGFGQMAVVLRHVSLLLLLHAGVTALQIGGFLWTQRSVLDAIGDPLLLIRFALVHFIYPRMTGIDDTWSGAGGCGLGSSGADEYQPSYCQD